MDEKSGQEIHSWDDSPMSQTLKAALDEILVKVSDAEAEIAARQAELTPLKITANSLAKLVGITEPFTTVDGPAQNVAPRLRTLSWRPDQFFGRPLPDCVSEILDSRKDAGLNGPATIDEIFDALKGGGFRFGGSGSDENSKRAVKISLTKNNTHFAKIGDAFGLRRWYPGSKSPSRKGRATEDEGGDESSSETSEDEAKPETKEDETPVKMPD
jgi:hypothetical protein